MLGMRVGHVPLPKLIARAERQDAVEREFVAAQGERRRADVRAARLLATIDGSAHFVYRGCSSLSQYGELMGLSGREARVLAAVGKVLELRPALEQRILAGKLSLDAAAALLRIYATPGMEREGDDWAAWAEQWSAWRLDREITKRAREVESGEPVSMLSAALTASGRERFERARQLASRREKRRLSEGETVEVLSDHYLDSFDPTRREPRPRRMPSTEGRTGRHVPVDVARKIVARQGDRCAVPGCDHNIWMNKAHVVAHRDGGSREEENLVYLCREHHVLLDMGLLVMAGTAERPVFTTPEQRPP